MVQEQKKVNERVRYRVLVERLYEEVYTTKSWEPTGKNKDDGESEYDYRSREEVRTVTQKLLEQEVEELDIKAVIAAVNKMSVVVEGKTFTP